MIGFSWDKRIRRAEDLAEQQPASAEILRFYARVARFQNGVYERLKLYRGELDTSLLQPDLPPFQRLIQDIGPPAVADRTNELDEFAERALLQPYMECVALRNPERRCPHCSEKPLLGVLRGEGEGGKRFLMCPMCSTEREFRRLVCPACGEEQNDRLPVYTAAGIEHVRVDACDTCHVYMKSIDLTKNGLAVPPVDEIATVSLDLWADEHGYTKITPNLLGM